MGAGVGGEGGMHLEWCYREMTHMHSRPPTRPHTEAYKRGLGAIFVGVNGEHYFLS